MNRDRRGPAQRPKRSTGRWHWIVGIIATVIGFIGLAAAYEQFRRAAPDEQAELVEDAAVANAVDQPAGVGESAGLPFRQDYSGVGDPTQASSGGAAARAERGPRDVPTSLGVGLTSDVGPAWPTDTLIVEGNAVEPLSDTASDAAPDAPRVAPPVEE